MSHSPTTDQSPAREPYAFLSYSHANEGLVRQFAAYLAQEEIPPWIDNRLEYGESWEQVITERIRGSTLFMIAMSPAARASEFVRRELELALRERKRIVPILIAGEPFEELREFQYVDLLDTARPYIRFVERVRDLVSPMQVPSAALQRRRVEHFVLRVFEEIFDETALSNVHLGIGFGRSFGVNLNQPLAELDELDWAEVFIIFREHLPGKDFAFDLDVDYGVRFPTIQDLSDFMLQNLAWPEIRRLDSTPRRRNGSGGGSAGRVIATAKNPGSH
jgi:hypothetical protein